ncbi:MAG: hypothetical protein ACRDZ5_00755 [Acidimicrobiales bacterium]
MRKPPRRDPVPRPTRPWSRPSPGSFVTDPLTGELAEISKVQPYQALKQYICPGCNQEIRKGAGHLVIVPLNRPAERRHWHDPCFERASRQRRH